MSEVLCSDEIVEQIYGVIVNSSGSDAFSLATDIWDKLIELKVAKDFNERFNGRKSSG